MAGKGKARVDAALRALADYSGNLPETSLLVLAPILERIVMNVEKTLAAKSWVQNGKIEVRFTEVLKALQRQLRSKKPWTIRI